MKRYYEKDGTMNEEVFTNRLAELHSEVDGADMKGLLSIRNKLYALKRKYEQWGRRFLDCEYEIIAINEIISEERR